MLTSFPGQVEDLKAALEDARHERSDREAKIEKERDTLKVRTCDTWAPARRPEPPAATRRRPPADASCRYHIPPSV